MLPCPPISIQLPLAATSDISLLLKSLPASHGVLILRGDNNVVITLVATGNLRRAAETRLASDTSGIPIRSRTELRSIVRSIGAVWAGSAFETDWAYLQLARQHMPQTYRVATDRWQPWFVQIDPAARFPQWSKTVQPGSSESPAMQCFGPLPDKHAAGRYLDHLTNIFDLCRYHHILVQAPNAAACAYKEMGRCAAPCDGSISLTEYGRSIADSIRFASGRCEDWLAEHEATMRTASAQHDFESAARIKAVLERAHPAMTPSLQHVRRLGDFAFIAVTRSEHARHVRFMLIRCGWIEPWLDVAADSKTASLQAVAEHLMRRINELPAPLDRNAVENIGLVCAHLFQQSGRKAPATFIPISVDQPIEPTVLARAIKSVVRRSSLPDDDRDTPPHDHELTGGDNSAA